MLRQFISACAVIALAATGAWAQNPSQIARAQSGADCAQCNLFQADLSYRTLDRIDLSRARLRQADLSVSTFNQARFDGADLSVSNLFAGRFTGARFDGADLRQATLVGAHFGGARFTGANLSGANLSGAELESARGLTQAQLSTACGDARTTLPPGLVIAPCRNSALTDN
ncbi:pentapeptide repeat-containing protein [Alkalicaulis satelles]|uniref:Pentapeptide repeat-containing protein n=1 Tax=Alkalicaulis satelles TaxID=2609175 RepID=A0A5M6ZR36_9PROT|nr:pentapeptide repeat-containing protein [Alkalicaulis satelles]KAA5804741.1 pentapeptide repeat-containing protein [Alkalicaulis satelles]